MLRSGDRTQLESSDIVLIDFGVSRPFINENGEHLPLEEDVPFSGNMMFQSQNAFKRLTLSRRDDIISILYNMIYLMNPYELKLGNLFQSKSFNQSYKQIREYKLKSSPEKICNETQRSKCLLNFCKEAYSYSFADTP